MVAWDKLIVSMIDKPSRALNSALYAMITVGLLLAIVVTLSASRSLTIYGYSISLEYWHYIPAFLLMAVPLIILMQLYEKVQTPLGKPNIESPLVLDGKPDQLLAKFSKMVEVNSSNRGVKSVKAVLHTGQVSVRALGKVLNATNVASSRVRVLVRTPGYEDYWRSNAIRRSVDDIRDFGFGYTFYSAPPFVHGFLIEYEDGSHDHFYSFYLHTDSGRTQIDDAAYVDIGRSKGSFYKVFTSWFEYHWGKSNRKVHTIVFDFDDTIADTGFIQVEAWSEALKQLPTQRKALLVDDVSKALKDDTLFDLVRARFERHQTASEIVDSLFQTELDSDTATAAKGELQKARMEIRVRNTSDARLFPAVRRVIPELAKNYYLAIVSATDENLIRDYLRKQGVLEYFGYVYGKFAPYENWSESIATKSQNLIKMSSILGVPLNRLAFIGDSNSDFVASQQIGVKFVEARIDKHRLGSASLIHGTTPPVSFSNYDQLSAVLQSFES